MSGFVERQFDSDDVAINVAEWADNGPPLLFIHGITSDWATWEKNVPDFVMDCRFSLRVTACSMA
jgi:pimeloyl-ACP methyl ester carboxylesterase